MERSSIYLYLYNLFLQVYIEIESSASGRLPVFVLELNLHEMLLWILLQNSRIINSGSLENGVHETIFLL